MWTLKPIFAFGGIFFLFATLNIEAKAYQLGETSQSQCYTHRHVTPPPSVKGVNPTLLVGLKSHLGYESAEKENTNRISLKAVNNLIELKDSSGLIHKSSTINIVWKKSLLKHPYKVQRQVIGPFASFESAESIANILKKKNNCVVISNPKEWEIWAAPEIKLPKEIHSTLFIKDIQYELKPYLQTSNNELPLSGILEISAPGSMQLDKGIYSGPFLLKPNAYGSWTLIEKVPLETYLEGVVPYEIGSSSPDSALSAQAVLARTWALANIRRYFIDGYHLCSTTQCQVYKDPSKVTKSVKKAIKSTYGKVLLWANKPIQAFYHASNGGVMASVSEAWSMQKMPYLKEKIDGNRMLRKIYKVPIKENNLKLILLNKSGIFGNDHKLFRWTRIVSSQEIKNSLISSKLALDIPAEINVLARGKSGRVVSLEIIGADSVSRRLLEVDEIRRTLKFLPSTLFIVKKLEEGLWEFQGGGFGHGVGLSQAGAIDLALQGWNTEEILSHYYPGTNLGPLPENWIAP